MIAKAGDSPKRPTIGLENFKRSSDFRSVGVANFAVKRCVF
jgi:hypothetical protein